MSVVKFMMQPRTFLRHYIRPRRHTALLVAIVAAFAVRPLIGDAGAGPLVFSIAVLILMLVGLYATQVDELIGERNVLLAQVRRRQIVGWTLAGFAVAERIVVLIIPSLHGYMLASIVWLLFFAFITATEFRRVLRQREITGETISIAISVYLLMGLTWGVCYALIFQLQPHAFNFADSADLASPQSFNLEKLFPIFIYFSLTTLSTIGFGDITPLTLQARYAAVAEGITGQLYLAILVARLVGMQMSRARHETGK